LIYDNKSNLTDFSNLNSVGTGAIILTPYLDLNGNGKRDPGEPKAPGLKVHINGGRIEQNIKDTTILITHLEAYTDYTIELDPTGFDRVAWQLPKKNYGVIVDPDFVKRIEVPVLVSGEASGRVVLKDNGDEQGLARILICFYNNKSVMVARTVSEADGYFTYLGLLPGVYSARIDTAQLSKLHLVSLTGSLPLTIIRSIDGSVVDGLGFILKSMDEQGTIKDSIDEKSAISSIVPISKNTNLPSIPFKLHNAPREWHSVNQKKAINIIAPISNGVTIQTAHFKLHNALASQASLAKYKYAVILVKADRPYFNVRIINVEGIKEARIIIKKIKHIGFPDAYILKGSGH
jgi:hypothetical protein